MTGAVSPRAVPFLSAVVFLNLPKNRYFCLKTQNMKQNNINTVVIVALVLAAAAARVVNASLHLDNFVPIAAISVFSGMMLKDKRALAFLAPILGQFLADLYFQLFTYIPGFYWATDMLFNYAAIAAATALGLGMKQVKPLTIAGFTLGASLTFFIVSNLGYFAHGWNGYSVSGLMKTYVDALPFYRNSFIADMAGGILLFGGYLFMQKTLVAKMQKADA